MSHDVPAVDPGVMDVRNIGASARFPGPEWPEVQPSAGAIKIKLSPPMILTFENRIHSVLLSCRARTRLPRQAGFPPLKRRSSDAPLRLISIWEFRSVQQACENFFPKQPH